MTGASHSSGKLDGATTAGFATVVHCNLDDATNALVPDDPGILAGVPPTSPGTSVAEGVVGDGASVCCRGVDGIAGGSVQ